ncbi:YcaO-like family protein [Halobacteria archaeon AArc-dxtr1]|nr:YcaO-like family protein [Halobacteria archaeon AArc-dxtr1]
MQVHVVGDDPVSAAVAAALEDVDIEVADTDPEGVEDARFAIVSGVAGSEAFERANGAAREGATPWIAVEIGGAGGVGLTDVDAAVSGYAPGGACFECLRTRVASGLGEEEPTQPTADRSAARLAGAVAGRECVRVLSGADESILGHVREVPHARRRLLPVPHCDCASGGRDRSLDLVDDDAFDLEAAVSHAELAIDSRLGPVASVGEAESFPAPYYMATLTETEGFSDASATTQSAGVADGWNAALMKAVGEGLERYCAGVYRDSDFVRASADELENPVTPTELVRPDDARAFDPETEIRWVDGIELATGEPAHLPADAVHFPPPGKRFRPAITTGLGLGSSTVDAVRAGLTEVIERDATMLAWYSTYEPLGLAVEHESFSRLARRARSEGLSVTPLLVTQDVDVPVVAVAVHRDPDDAVGGDDETDAWPRFAMGSAADLDAAAAAVSALEEALQNWMELRSIGPENAAEGTGQIGEYATFPEPVRELVAVEQTIPADSVGPEPAPTGTDGLSALVSRATDAGLTPYAARVTTRDVASAGFEAVRVVVPEAQPLFTGDPFFGGRARTVPESLGFEPRLERSYHPYP